MPDVTVPSTDSPTPPSDPSKTQVLSVRVLVGASGGVPAFNQGSYSDPLPVQNAKGDRTIQSSGCGLCAWASALAAAGCRAPVLNGKTFSLPQDAATINPSSLLKYFSDYAVSQNTSSAAAKTWAQQNIFAGSNDGVLQNMSKTVQAAINQLLSLNYPNTTPQFDNITNASTGGATGTDVPGVTAALEAGSPVILAVHFTGSSEHSNHQVLAVGIAKVIDKTYYVINDSGFGITDPLPKLRQTAGHVDKDVLGGCTASSKRNPPDKDNSGVWGYDSIYKYRALGGLQPYTKLTLKGPPF